MNDQSDLGTAADSKPPVEPTKLAIELSINGVKKTLTIEPWVTLLDLLRERLDLTGSKKGCDHGQCGACTVLVDGKRANACLMGSPGRGLTDWPARGDGELCNRGRGHRQRRQEPQG